MIEIAIAVGTNYGSTATTTTTISSSTAVVVVTWRLHKNNSKAGSGGTDIEGRRRKPTRKIAIVIITHYSILLPLPPSRPRSSLVSSCKLRMDRKRLICHRKQQQQQLIMIIIIMVMVMTYRVMKAVLVIIQLVHKQQQQRRRYSDESIHAIIVTYISQNIHSLGDSMMDHASYLVPHASCS